MVDRKLETFIHKDNVKALIAPFLKASGLVNKEEDLIDISLGDVNDLIPITLNVKRMETVEEDGS